VAGHDRPPRRVPLQKGSAPNRTAEERDRPARPVTYPEEGRRGRNRIAQGERRLPRHPAADSSSETRARRSRGPVRGRPLRRGRTNGRSGLGAHPSRAAAPAAAEGVEDLFTVVVEGAQEHPSLEAVKAVALPILGIVEASRCGIVERVASPYTGVVHKVPPSFLWAGPRGALPPAGPFPFLLTSYILAFCYDLAMILSLKYWKSL
jgi:hypothetical protein